MIRCCRIRSSQYAPVVHGIAHTNARVVITQNGNTILETTVSPGAFEINDLYATGYGGDLHVTVYEADGSQEQLHGSVCLGGAAAASRGVALHRWWPGKCEQPSLSGTERFAQATLQHGFNNYLTGYTGAVGAQALRGPACSASPSTRCVGARGGRSDRRPRHCITDTFSSSGQSLRFSYSKLVPYTQTNITLSTYRYSSSGYYSFSDAQSAPTGGARRLQSRHR